MSSITIIGAGNMGTAIAGLALAAGSEVQVLTREATDLDPRVVPDGSSAAAQIQQRVPGARVLKAFNTNFAATLASGQVGPLPTTVHVAGDDADAKAALAGAVSGVRVVDAGSLKRAHELEALGFLQLTLAAGEKTSWTTGFALAE